MTLSFNSAAGAIEYLSSEIKNVGKERFDSFYLQNASFVLSRDSSFDGMDLSKEAKADFEWSWAASCGIRELAPLESYYRKRFGDGVRPYGDAWDIPSLLVKIEDPVQRRRAILYNGQDACLSSFQFWVTDKDLDVTVNMRSSDVGEMLPLDIQYTRFLQERLCAILEFTPGTSYYNIANAHILK